MWEATALPRGEDRAAPVIGATKIGYLENAVGALGVTLTPDEVSYLEEAYVPHAVAGPV